MSLCLQKKYAAKSICYGCGPANAKGLQIQSFVEGDTVLAHFTPEAHHNAFPDVLNGGIIGTLLDCHCNWAAAWFLMQAQGLDAPPCTVTADYAIKLKRPTPMNTTLTLKARLVKIEGARAQIEGELIANDKVCATCLASFVAVDETHPAFHRW